MQVTNHEQHIANNIYKIFAVTLVTRPLHITHNMWRVQSVSVGKFIYIVTELARACVQARMLRARVDCHEFA